MGQTHPTLRGHCNVNENPWDDDPEPRRPGGGGWWLLLMLALGALIAFLAWRFPGHLETDRDWLQVVYLVGLVALVSGGVMAGRRARWREAAKQVAAWAAIAVIAIAGYSYRFEIETVGNRMLAELVPGYGVAGGDGSVVFRVGDDGHFRVRAVVDGVALDFLVDTGASDVALTRADARRLGFDLDALAYIQPYTTANGVVYGAPVTLREVVVGPIRLSDVAASVTRAPMGGASLLGMSFLGRLSAYEVSNGSLTLRQ